MIWLTLMCIMIIVSVGGLAYITEQEVQCELDTLEVKELDLE